MTSFGCIFKLVDIFKNENVSKKIVQTDDVMENAARAIEISITNDRDLSFTKHSCAISQRAYL